MTRKPHFVLLTILVIQAAFAGLAAAEDAGRFPSDLQGINRPVWRDGEDTGHWRKNLFKRFITDQKFLVTTWVPIESRRMSFYLPLTAGMVSAAGSNARRGGFDVGMSRSIENWTERNGSGVAEAFSTLGDGVTGIALVGTTHLISRWSGNTRMVRATSLSAEAALNSALWNSVLKRATRRARPSSDTLGGTFGSSGPGVEANSFPSGHSMGAFSVAAVFATEYRDKRWVAGVAYGTAGLIAASRVGLGRHYVSDVVVGAVLGRSLGRMVTARQRGLEILPVSDRFEPIVDPLSQSYGVSYRRSW